MGKKQDTDISHNLGKALRTKVTDNEAMTEGGEAFTSYDPSTIDDLASYLQTVTE